MLNRNISLEEQNLDYLNAETNSKALWKLKIKLKNK